MEYQHLGFFHCLLNPPLELDALFKFLAYHPNEPEFSRSHIKEKDLQEKRASYNPCAQRILPKLVQPSLFVPQGEEELARRNEVPFLSWQLTACRFIRYNQPNYAFPSLNAQVRFKCVVGIQMPFGYFLEDSLIIKATFTYPLAKTSIFSGQDMVNSKESIKSRFHFVILFGLLC